MHGQGNYPTPVRQERPSAPQPQAYQSFHPYQHLGPTVSGGLGSAQSYLPHHRPPYPTSEQQPLQWSRNVHPLPFPGPSGYQLPTSQGHYAALVSDPSHSHPQPVGPMLLPPPPPLHPPPPPTSSPPVVPPIPQSSPPSDTGSKRDGGGSLKGLLDRNNLMMESPHLLKPAEYKSANETQVLFHNTEKSGTEVGSADAVVAQSPIDSDMDMEDDITHPDEEKKNCLSINANDEHVSKSEEDYVKEQLQPSHQAGGLTLPVHENSLLVVASVSEAEKGGSKIASFHGTMKVTSKTNDSGISENGQDEHPSDVGEEDSSARPKNFRQPSVPVVYSESGGGKLSGQSMGSASPFKLLQGYASDNSSENDEANLLTNVSLRSANDVSTNFDAEKGCEFGSELRHETQAESNRHILSKSMVESPRNVMQTDKLSVPGHIVEGVSDRSHRCEEPTIIRDVSPQTKDSRNYDVNTGPESANLHKTDARSNSSKLNVDEFGRLVREGVSDSDTSDSPRYARRHARRTRKRSRSRSRSRSPHDRRRRRRSPLRRKERRSRSRSLSPKKRRSRSRTPVMRRAGEFGGDKLRREKGQVPECFDFLRGKCYRGATCRYSHHESNKNERSRYKRDKQHYQDGSRDLQSPDVQEESKNLVDKEMKHRGSPLHMPVSMEAKNVKRPLDDSTADSLSKLGSLGSGSLPVADDIASNNSGYSAPVLILGKDKSLALETAVQYSNDIPQTVYQQGERTIDTVVSESTARAIPATSTHCPADIPDAKQGPTSNLSSVGAPTTKPYSTEEVSSHSLTELLPSITNPAPHLTIPIPSALQAVSAPFAQPTTQDYNSKPPISWNYMIPENNSPYQAPAAYQHSQFQGLSKPLSSSFVQLPLPPPPPPPAAGEHGISSLRMQQSKLPAWNGSSSYTSMRSQPMESPFQSQTGQYQANSLAREADQMLHSTDNFGSSNIHVSNLMTRQGGPHRVVEDCSSGHAVQGVNPSLAQTQPNTLLSKGMHSSVTGGLPMGSTSDYRPYFQHASYGLQHSAAGLVPASHAELGTVSSSSRITPGFLETNRPSYVRDFLESRTSNFVNTYASSFNVPPSSKFSSNVLIQENYTAINTKYGAPVGMSTAPVDAHKIGIVGSDNRSVLPRPSGEQYDPLFDYIEPASNSFSKADHQKHETIGDSDEVLGISGSGRVLNMEGIKQEGGGSTASANDSPENEECGETADIEVDGVLNATPSNPNDATDNNAGDIEIDQVKTFGKKKKSKERSMKHFKISIATFVKEVLKPSWRQGNMSKEAFKTIVKKTVDKVSGAMKSHQIPKSQAKINHYIDSSRGKLTKLVMGYVDKYVKV